MAAKSAGGQDTDKIKAEGLAVVLAEEVRMMDWLLNFPVVWC